MCLSIPYMPFPLFLNLFYECHCSLIIRSVNIKFFKEVFSDRHDSSCDKETTLVALIDQTNSSVFALCRSISHYSFSLSQWKSLGEMDPPFNINFKEATRPLYPLSSIQTFNSWHGLLALARASYLVFWKKQRRENAESVIMILTFVFTYIPFMYAPERR